MANRLEQDEVRRGVEWQWQGGGFSCQGDSRLPLLPAGHGGHSWIHTCSTVWKSWWWPPPSRGSWFITETINQEVWPLLHTAHTRTIYSATSAIHYASVSCNSHGLMVDTQGVEQDCSLSKLESTKRSAGNMVLTHNWNSITCSAIVEWSRLHLDCYMWNNLPFFKGVCLILSFYQLSQVFEVLFIICAQQNSQKKYTYILRICANTDARLVKIIID